MYCSFNNVNLYILALYKMILETIILMMGHKLSYLTSLPDSRELFFFLDRIWCSSTECLFACSLMFFLVCFFHCLCVWLGDEFRGMEKYLLLSGGHITKAQKGGPPAVVGLMSLVAFSGWADIDGVIYLWGLDKSWRDVVLSSSHLASAKVLFACAKYRSQWLWHSNQYLFTHP